MLEKKELELISLINNNTFLIGDTHFGHKNILKYSPCRANKMKKMKFKDHDEWIISEWNKTIQKNDLVIHVGDFAFKGINNLIGKLNGNIILILGNHDRSSKNTYNKLFELILSGTYIYLNNNLKKIILNEKDNLESSIILELNGKKVLISHYPATKSERDFYEKKANYKMVKRLDNLIKFANDNKIDINIHGHTHNRNIIDETVQYKFFNVSLENINHKPIKFFDLFQKLS